MENYKTRTNSFEILVVLILIGIFSFSCSVTSIPIEILVPAEINITKQIKHVGIINRTIPVKKRKIVNFLEGFITGESIFADRMGAENCINGLAEKLNASPRFAAVIIQGEMVRGSGTRSFPPPMNWSKVEDVCRRYNVDALIALETFDSNIHFDVKKKYKTKKIKTQNSGEKKKVKVPKYYAHLGIDVNSGWRIYDPSSKLIIDMNTFRDRKNWRSSDDSRKDAVRGLPGKRDAINVSGYNAGIQYGIRISPTWVNMSRDFYVKGDPGLKNAKRYVRDGDWESAISIWEKLTENDDMKIAGRASYNLAFAYEIKGDFNKAYRWAKRSYSEFGNRRAGRYMETIRDRITDKYLLEDQLED